MFRKRKGNHHEILSFPRVCGDVPPAGPRPWRRYMFSPRMRGCSSSGNQRMRFSSVFPAYAGMFRLAFQLHALHACFPRVCGDVPNHAKHIIVGQWFSPRMRGCSERKQKKDPHQLVFPAYAGMFRIDPNPILTCWCFPRVCGDVPYHFFDFFNPFRFSPRMRGCSSTVRVSFRTGHVFPAYAGMFLPSASPSSRGASFPRVCGDVPAVTERKTSTIPVFPAYAGMFRRVLPA